VSTDEQRAYSRGYAAGLRKRKADRSQESMRRERQAFWDRAFFAALGSCISVDGWKDGDKPINDIPSRVELARDFANQALHRRRYVS
jgi:hypothetical protein